MTVLSDGNVTATLPAADIDRAERFYAEMLDLRPVSVTPQGLTYECGNGTRFIVFPSQGSASGSHTQLTFIVGDIEGEVGDLKANGVAFEEYDLPQLKTVNSIAVTDQLKSAWFKDSEGNLLNITEIGGAEPVPTE
jgi:catechol 2,3-dioxygenase-like lactoylglutathione lyase family enzyme